MFTFVINDNGTWCTHHMQGMNKKPSTQVWIFSPNQEPTQGLKSRIAQIVEAHQDVSCTNTGRIFEGRGIKNAISGKSLYRRSGWSRLCSCQSTVELVVASLKNICENYRSTQAIFYLIVLSSRFNLLNKTQYCP